MPYNFSLHFLHPNKTVFHFEKYPASTHPSFLFIPKENENGNNYWLEFNITVPVIPVKCKLTVTWYSNDSTWSSKFSVKIFVFSISSFDFSVSRIELSVWSNLWVLRWENKRLTYCFSHHNMNKFDLILNLTFTMKRLPLLQLHNKSCHTKTWYLQT